MNLLGLIKVKHSWRMNWLGMCKAQFRLFSMDSGQLSGFCKGFCNGRPSQDMAVDKSLLTVRRKSLRCQSNSGRRS